MRNKQKTNPVLFGAFGYMFVLFGLLAGVLGFGGSARAAEVCPEGEITSSCLCNGAEHSNGYCCTGVWDSNACRIFYEDCEDTSFSEWFLERSMGTSSYWDELTTELTRSDESPHSGKYCMTYDPWTTGNPHTNVGYPVTHGNTGGFLWHNVNTSTYYFKWYQRWETGINYSGGVANKNIYIGYGEWGGDFTFTLKKCGSNNYHITIRSNPGYTIRYNRWLSFSGGDLDDMEWHKIEVYLNLGSTGPTGSFFVKIDDIFLVNESNIYFRDQINQNDGVALGIVQWPSNISGTPVGTGRTWLDDLEIWDGMPNETAQTCTEAGGICMTNSCNTYTNCTSLNGECTTGYCCSGTCTPDTTPPTLSNSQPTGTLSSGTTQTTISLTTDETAVCKYSTTAGTDYDSMENTFSSTNSTTHSQTITGLSDGNTYHYYVRCQDESGNQNTDDFEISFSVASPSHAVYGLSNFIQLAADWLKSEPPALESDVNGDGIVNTRDLGIMMSNWSE